jgi:hypothetical protein
MNRIIRGFVCVSAAMLLCGTANAAITVYTSQSAFLAALSGTHVDTFNDLVVDLYPDTLIRSAGPYTYQVSSESGLFGGMGTSAFLTNNFSVDPIVFSGFTGGVSAIGGFFFGSDEFGQPLSGDLIVLTIADTFGSTQHVISSSNTGTFRGFITNGTLASLDVDSDGSVFPSVENLTLGMRSAVPEPTTWAFIIFGFGAVGYSMRRKQKVSVSYA